MKKVEQPRASETDVTVGKLFKVFGGGTPSTSVPKFWQGSIPWITSADLGDDLKITPRKSIAKEAVNASATNLVPAGSVIVATRVGLGKVGVAETPLCFSQDCQGLIVDTKACDPKFVALQLKQRVQIFRYIGRGTTINGVTKKQLLDLPFENPPLTEQQRIVSELEKQFSRLDEAVTSLKRVKANLRRYRAAVLKAAVEGKLTEEWRKEHPDVEPASKLLERILAERRSKWSGRGKYKEPVEPDTSNLPELPDRWVWATMPKLGELNRGRSKHRPRDDARLYSGPYPFIQTGDIRKSGGTIRTHSQAYSKLGLQQSRLWPAGTLCITIAANIAETGILTYSACFPDSVVGFIHDGDPVTTRYVEFFLRTARERLERFAPATAQKNINLDVLQNVAVPLPPLAEQQCIVAQVERRLSVVEELEAAVEANQKRADRLRQSILKRAFEGKLVLQDLQLRTYA